MTIEVNSSGWTGNEPDDVPSKAPQVCGEFRDRAQLDEALSRVVVAGGGAGGVELAFALRNRAGADPRPQVALVTGAGGLLPGFSAAVRRRVAEA